MERTLNSETINQIGQTVTVKGFVNARRNMGKLAFLDLRDRSGLLQVVLVPSELDEASKAIMPGIRPEFVLEIEGLVQARGEKQVNPNSPTGTVEVLAKKIAVLSAAETPPFEIDKENMILRVSFSRYEKPLSITVNDQKISKSAFAQWYQNDNQKKSRH